MRLERFSGRSRSISAAEMHTVGLSIRNNSASQARRCCRRFVQRMERWERVMMRGSNGTFPASSEYEDRRAAVKERQNFPKCRQTKFDEIEEMAGLLWRNGCENRGKEETSRETWENPG